MYLETKELACVVGGGFSATMLNALSRAVSTIYDIGYAIGSTLRRVLTKKTCKL